MSKNDPKKFLMYYRIAEYLLDGLSKRQISKKIGISRNTLHSILNEPEFNQFYERLCNELYQSLKNHYISLVRLTIQNIEKYLQDKDIDVKEKMKICLGVLRSCNIEIKF